MAEFLSDAWIAELDSAARRVPGLQLTETFILEQHVERIDDEVVYVLHFDATGARVTRGAAAAPDLVVRTDAATALALHRGELRAQEAAASGRLKVHGRVERLRVAGEALASLDDVFRDVRAATTAPDDRGDAHPH